MTHDSEKIVSLLKHSVHLDAYSDSPGYLGYGNVHSGNRVKMVKHNIAAMLEVLSPIQTHGLTLIESMHAYRFDLSINDESLSPSLDRIVDIIDEHDCPFSNDSVEYDQFFYNLQHEQFTVLFDINAQLFEEVSWTVMGRDAPLINGHAFFLLRREGLFIYPHDDGGYGFILANGSPIPDILINKFRSEGLLQKCNE